MNATAKTIKSQNEEDFDLEECIKGFNPITQWIMRIKYFYMDTGKYDDTMLIGNKMSELKQIIFDNYGITDYFNSENQNDAIHYYLYKILTENGYKANSVKAKSSKKTSYVQNQLQLF